MSREPPSSLPAREPWQATARRTAVALGLAFAAWWLLDTFGPDAAALQSALRARTSSPDASVRSTALLGPLLAVALVLGLRRPVVGLVVALLLAGVAHTGSLGAGVAWTVSEAWGGTLRSTDNLLILGFTAAMLGLVHVGIAAGGFADLARRLAAIGRRDGDSARADDGAASARRTRVSTVALGVAVFFDDYANALLVGGTMQPLAARTGVSRAMLAFLVDATSAAVAGVALVSTWVGFEIGLLKEQLPTLQAHAAIAEAVPSAYAMFLAVLPYRFYCLFVLALAIAAAWSGRALGAMRAEEIAAAQRWASERQAPRRADVQQTEAAAGRWFDAVLPIAALMVTVAGWDLAAGWGALGDDGQPADLLGRFIAGAESAGLQALALGGLVGSLVAIGWSAGRGLLRPAEAARSWLAGVVGTLPILLILTTAMAMRVVTEADGAGPLLAAMLDGVSGPWLPLLSFLTAGVVAFMTGSSWATMGILLPMVVPLAAGSLETDGAAAVGWVLASAAAVLDGAIFGDHCSPLSDTTVMSSAASGCPHDLHVRTQLPYALLAMVAAASCGYGATAFLGVAPTLVWPAGVAVAVGGLYLWGLPVPHAAWTPAAAPGERGGHDEHDEHHEHQEHQEHHEHDRPGGAP